VFLFLKDGRGTMKRVMALLVASALAAWAAVPALAHPHTAQNGQTIANGQLHGVFNYDPVTDLLVSCDGQPAAYGLESAHHGPDLGTPGNVDGCYATSDPDDASPPPDRNPGIN
jgi:hypothetical protein